MTDKPENPPAFPHSAEFMCQNSDGSYSTRAITDNGMTLRDYFAGQVIAGMRGDAGLNASYAYHVADAMLEARLK